jgi:hypothetical protein
MVVAKLSLRETKPKTCCTATCSICPGSTCGTLARHALHELFDEGGSILEA